MSRAIERCRGVMVLADTCYGFTGGDKWVCQKCGSYVVTRPNQPPNRLCDVAISQSSSAAIQVPTGFTPPTCGICGAVDGDNNRRVLHATKRCDRCYELEHRIQADPELAAKILSALEKAPETIVLGIKGQWWGGSACRNCGTMVSTSSAYDSPICPKCKTQVPSFIESLIESRDKLPPPV